MFKIRVPITCTLRHVGKRLANGVSVIVIEDPANTKPAAAMAFGVGKNNDPADFPGLAHFCEHMLFMGTAKYPSEDAYHCAVKQNGGSCNASTSNDQTCYHFSSSLSSYRTILDMFLEFFVDPSFNASAVDRELNAVNSEDERNHTADGRRVEEMLKTFVVPSHPRHRYGSGNMTTLRDEPNAKGLSIHDALRTFFNAYYVAERSSLVLYSPFPAEEMLALVEGPLLRIRSGAPAPPQTFVPRGSVMRPEALGSWCNVLNTSKQRSISLKWPLPYGRSDAARNPSSFLSHMIGHEVDGTVLAALRSNGLATALSAGGGAFDGENEEFSVKIVLTDVGAARIAEVIDVVFHFIELLRREWMKNTTDADAVDGEAEEGGRPALLHRFREMVAERARRFEYREASAAASHATNLSRGAVSAGPERAFCGYSVAVSEDDEASFEAEAMEGLREAFETILGAVASNNGGNNQPNNKPPLLSIERCIVVFSVGAEADLAKAAAENEKDFFGADASLSQTTRFHKMRYSVAPFSAAMLKRWGSEALAAATLNPLLRIPRPNPFINVTTAADDDDKSGDAPSGTTVANKSNNSSDYAVFSPPHEEGQPPARVETQFGYALVRRCEAHLRQPKLYAYLNLMLTGATPEGKALFADHLRRANGDDGGGGDGEAAVDSNDHPSSKLSPLSLHYYPPSRTSTTER